MKYHGIANWNNTCTTAPIISSFAYKTKSHKAKLHLHLWHYNRCLRLMLNYTEVFLRLACERMPRWAWLWPAGGVSSGSCPRTSTWSIGDMDQNPSLSQLHLTPRFPQLITEMILELITEMTLTQSGGNQQNNAKDEWKNVEIPDSVRTSTTDFGMNCGQI